MQLCYLGSAVCNHKGKSYPPDYQIYKSDLDYYAEIMGASENFTYTEYTPPYTKSVTVNLLRQVSISNCSLGVSYGLTEENHLWVDLGCRAQFAIGV
ncbi:unnamed protein product [Candidula unifasciata]|uniref:Uncharacterized protein n=1 Tax=Candidula unifasciata TaxID=100452 RepID=A0A8S3ZUS3_9EUPU|nr:unnamed protein product [Candidula unifasciata]